MSALEQFIVYFLKKYYSKSFGDLTNTIICGNLGVCM